MNLLKNWLAQTLVICLTTYGVLCCAPAATPCKIRILVPDAEAKITGLTDAGVECTENTAVANSGFNTGKPGVDDRTCEIPNGHMIQVPDKACDTDDVPGEPIIVDGARILPPNHIDLKCNQGVLPAIKDDDTIDNDVHQIACHSAITERNCDFTLMDIDEASIIGNVGGTNPNRYIREGQKFTIAANACEKNGFNVPLNINGFANPPVVNDNIEPNPNVETTYICSKGKLQATGAAEFVTAPDVSMIRCEVLCVLDFNLNPLAAAPALTDDFGTCNPITDNPNPRCIAIPGVDGTIFDTRSLCAVKVDLVDSNGNGDLFPTPAGDPTAIDDSLELLCNLDGSISAIYTDASEGTADLSVDIELVTCN